MKAFSLPQALFSKETRARIAWEPFRDGVEISWVYQTDENGRYAAGDVVINPPDTVHSIHSEDGCVVLAVWQKPVEFVDSTS